MKVDLCLSPKVFSKAQVLDKLPQLRRVFRAHSVQLAYLFGSVIKGQSDKLSDVDIAVLPDPKSYDWLETYGEIFHDLCSLFGADNIDLLLLNEAPLSLRFRAVKDGILIYESSEPARSIFEDNTVQSYLDSKPLRNEHWEQLIQRLKDGVTNAVRNVDKERIETLFRLE